MGPKARKYVKKHIYGEGFYDAFSSIASALYKPAKKAVTGLVESGLRKLAKKSAAQQVKRCTTR